MEMISMIPFGLLSGFAEFETNAGLAEEKSPEKRLTGERTKEITKEIRITGIEEERFCFRLAEWEGNPCAFRICFYEMEKKAYREIRIENFEVEKIRREEFWTAIFVRVRSLPEFQDAVRKLIVQYDRYIRLKLECREAEVSKALTGYPAELDEIHRTSLKEQKNSWFGNVEYGCSQNQNGRKQMEEQPEDQREDQRKNQIKDQRKNQTRKVQTRREKIELALELDQPYLYEYYLDNPIEKLTYLYWKKNGLEKFCLASVRPDRLYIGNAYCPLLFPEKEILMQILDKMKEESLGVTLVFSYLRQEQIEEFERLLETIEIWCRESRECIEIEVNDWAVADLVKNRTKYLRPCLGILLNKRRKDPRGRYQQNQSHQNHKIHQTPYNNLYAEFYREFLRERFGIQRYEWESTGGLPKSAFPGAHNSLHFPFYQTNTSQYCTLYAGCIYGNRGKQTLITACPKFCTRFVYLYPEHLKMAGRGNSLFGFDDKILHDLQGNKTHKIPEIPEGIDRLVVNLMETGASSIFEGK